MTADTSIKKSFDISSLAASDEADLHILDADGNRTGWVWTFAGPNHPATISADNDVNARYVAREQAKERTIVNGRKWKGSDETPEELRQRSIDYVVARLLRWSEMTMEGKPFPYTAENARLILSDRKYATVYDQANGFLIEEKSFLKRSVKN